MEYRTLGRTGLRVSNICLGTMTFGWTADKATSFAIMSEYVARGGNFFDTADVYSFWADNNPGGVSETWIGEWLKQSGVPHDQIVIATKAGLRMWDGPDGEGLSPAHLMRAVEGSLRRLQVETIDLYQAHWPDENTLLEETLRAFGDLVQQGKVRLIGCSNYNAARLRQALAISQANGLVRYESLQPHYNLVHRADYEGQLMDLCSSEDIGVLSYSSLARGFLTGRYRRGWSIPEKALRSESLRPYLNDQGFAVVDRLETVAQVHNATIAQTAIAWVLANPTITSAITSASTVEQLTDTLYGADLLLSAEEKASLDAASAWAA